MKNKFIFLLASLGLISGCTSMSTLQDARTTKSGEIEQVIAVGNLGTKVSLSGATGVKGDVGEEVQLPMFEYMLRYGINDKWDVGLRTTGFTYGLDTKYNLLSKENFLVSIGLGYSKLSYEVSSGSVKNEFTSTDITLPLYLNYEFAAKNLLYLVPKYIMRTIKTTGHSDADVNYIGATLGYRYKKVFIEYTLLQGELDGEDLSLNQSAIGLKF